MLVSLDEHISELTRLVSEIDDFVEWESVYEWLNIANSIDSISIDTTKNNSSFGWCRDADEYDLARSDLLQISIKKLAVFNFIWGALEASIDIVKPEKHPEKDKRGKISNTCFLLKKSFSSHSQLIGLNEQTAAFKDHAALCFGFGNVESRLSKLTEYGSSGIGLYAVYELRNLFAHGSLSFPQPDGFNRPRSPFNSLVDHASHIVLMSIQMLMLHHFDYDFYEVWHNNDTVQLKTVLRNCHLISSDQEGQIALL
ncbi:hypothetical protein [Rheinheimera oceanensis]|uniref:hypothetical protein n=1 Tax=Rheinheimera oceanensis TaxID=2817449 RepID=UPI001BFD2CB7|nr:hypothetical protein [Rheinheimera oceanensis]